VYYLPNLSIWPNQQNSIAIHHIGTCNDYVKVKEGPTPEVVDSCRFLYSWWTLEFWYINQQSNYIVLHSLFSELTL